MTAFVAFVTFAVLLVAAAFSLPTQLHYKIGEEFDFQCNSVVDSRGLLQDGTRTSGSYSVLTGIVAIKPLQFKDNKYLFVMNMFNVKVDVGQNSAESSQPSSMQSVTAGADPLGYDMYFSQTPTGEIPEIWYYSGDSPYFVNVKVSAINAFQTRVVSPGSPLQAQEHDPVGYHYSTFIGADKQTNLLVTKSFTQQDVLSFPDKNLKSSNIRLNAQTATAVHAEGHIMSSTVSQLVALVNVGSGSTLRNQMPLSTESQTPDTKGFDMAMSSSGTLTITLERRGQLGRFTRTLLTLAELEQLESSLYVRSNMFEFAQRAVEFAALQLPLAGIDNLTKTLFTQNERLSKNERFRILHDILRYAEATNDLSFLEPYLRDVLTPTQRRDVFYILAGVTKSELVEEAQRLLVNYGLKDPLEFTKLQAILAAGSSPQTPTSPLVDALVEIIQTDRDILRTHAILSLGAVLSRASDETLIAKMRSVLAYALETAIEAQDKHDIVTAVNAIGNAGPQFASLENTWRKVSKALRVEDKDIQATVFHSLRKFPMVDVVRLFTRQGLLSRENALRLLAANYDTDTAQFLGSNFPYNKSFSRDYVVGGSRVNAKFDAELFLGTNFDCNQKYFNYEALAQTEAIVNFYSYRKSAFLAKAIYGKANGVLIGNEILVRLWDHVLYDQKLPTVDCSLHMYQIAHAAPGIHISYTVWVSIIPVTFTAGVDTDLKLSWGWQICDGDLSAMVELVPEGGIVLSGQAEINLLIIRAGLLLSGNFGVSLIPQAYIHGSQCTVGVDVELKTPPFGAQFEAYYAWRECKLWIFDCHWGKHNEHVFWGWHHPGVNQVLFKQEWKIAKSNK
jgi:hypothetical protein